MSVQGFTLFCGHRPVLTPQVNMAWIPGKRVRGGPACLWKWKAGRLFGEWDGRKARASA